MSEEILVFTEENGEEIHFQLSTNEEEGFRGDDDETKVQRAKQLFQEALKPIRNIANHTLHTINEFAESPEEVTLSLSVQFTGEGSIVFAKTKAEANLSLTIKWTQQSIERAQEKLNQNPS